MTKNVTERVNAARNIIECSEYETVWSVAGYSDYLVLRNYTDQAIKPVVYEGYVTKKSAEYLLKNHNNSNYRQMKPNNVDKLVDKMLNGYWRSNGDTIAVDNRGNIINGQHRMKAIVKSGIGQPILFVEGLDTDLYLTYDDSYGRSLVDEVKNRNEDYLSGAVGLVRYYIPLKSEKMQVGQSSSNSGVYNEDVRNIYEADKPGFNYAVRFGKKINKWSESLLKPSEVGAIYYYLTNDLGYDSEFVENFFTGIAKSQYDGGLFWGIKRQFKSLLKKSDSSERKRIFIDGFNSYVNGNTNNCNCYGTWFAKCGDKLKFQKKAN